MFFLRCLLVPLHPPQTLDTVLIVDDHDLFAESLATLLRTQEFATTVSIATSASSALTRLTQRNYELVLCDMGLPDLSGLELLREIKEKYPQTRVCMLSGSDDLQGIASALELSADGYLLKSAQLDEFLGSLRAIYSGRLALTAEFSRALLRMHHQSPRKKLLTLRQQEILGMVAEGWTAREISSELKVSVDTVRTTIRRVHRRLGVNSAVAAVAEGFRRGLLT